MRCWFHHPFLAGIGQQVSQGLGMAVGLLDEVLRETAANFKLLEERISDTAIHHRLKACVPWVKALLSRMMGDAAKPLLEGHLRFLIVDGSTVQGPGAKGTENRLHMAIDLVNRHGVDPSHNVLERTLFLKLKNSFYSAPERVRPEDLDKTPAMPRSGPARSTVWRKLDPLRPRAAAIQHCPATGEPGRQNA